jgi:polyisoprenoid-binding protein YceI
VNSPFAPILVPLAALVASLVRWWMQGSGNLWTALHKRFYVPDAAFPDGWKESVFHPIWLGLEVCAVIAAIAAGLAIGGWIIRRREDRRELRSTVLRAAAWALGAVTLVVPIAAFASGPGASGGRDTLPTGGGAVLTEGIAGSLDAPAGSYAIVAHAGTAVTAHLSAGKEAFDARFSGVAGTLSIDPHDLTKPIAARVTVQAATVDTGIGERSKHAREEYLLVGKFPTIELALGQLVAASPGDGGALAFRAKGTVTLMGKQHAVDVTGTLRKGSAQLGVDGDVLLVAADFSLVIKETALAGDAGDFDGDHFPIHVSLVLRHL